MRKCLEKTLLEKKPTNNIPSVCSACFSQCIFGKFQFQKMDVVVVLCHVKHDSSTLDLSSLKEGSLKMLHNLHKGTAPHETHVYSGIL